MNPVELPTAGFHYGVPYEVYARWPAANFSKIKPIRDTASKCKWEMDHPKAPTPSMVLGSALHVAILEPARFESLFYICPPCDRRTTEGKEIFEKAQREAGSKLLIRQGSKDDEAAMGQVESIRGMAASVLARKSAAPFLSASGQNEVCGLWMDDETGLWCKMRADRLLPEFPIWEAPVIVEAKSTRDASPRGFARDVDNFGYAAQAACYRIGVKAITGKSPVHVFIAVENFAPFDSAVYTLDDASLQAGEAQYRQMLKRYAECVRSGEWPGYPDQCETLRMPEYSLRREYAD